MALEDAISLTHADVIDSGFLNSHEDSDAAEKKNATEIELERRLFGDDAGFHEDIRSLAFAHVSNVADSTEIYHEGQHRGDDFENTRDQDLYFFDIEPSQGHALINNTESSSEAVSRTLQDDSPAWVDSDDERLLISLASNPRLRKFRISEMEDLVNGKEYTMRLRQQYERLHHTPKWANYLTSESAVAAGRARSHPPALNDPWGADDSPSDSSDAEDALEAQPLAKLLRSTAAMVSNTASSRRTLRPEIIDMHRLKDIGSPQPSAVTKLSFHPIHPILMTAGSSSMLSLHLISPQPSNPNPLLTSLYVRSTPLTAAQFCDPDGSQVFFAGRRRYYHVWDLASGKIQKVSRVYGHQNGQKSMERFKLSPCGRWMGLVGSSRKGGGFINVLNAVTNQWVAEVRVEGRGGVADFAWWGDGEGMVVLGKGGEAVEWDRRINRIVARWIDEGAVGTTVVALGDDGAGPLILGRHRWLAVGSSSGVVNIYDRRKWATDTEITVSNRPSPVRALDQLTTPSSHLDFSPDGQILCIASRWKRDALRLVHLPTCTVYRNWPTAQTPLGRITAVGWNATGSMLAVGNEQGKIRLWERGI